MSEPITREEMYLAALGGEEVTLPDPLTREELYLAYLNGMTDTYPEPITRTEQYLYKLCQNGMGGGGGVVIKNQPKTITENGTYKHDSGYTGLGTVTVAVPQQDPVVQPLEVTENGTYSPPAGVDGYSPVTVNVEASGGGEDYLEKMLSNKLESYTNENITTIPNHAFYGITSLKSLNLPNFDFLGGLGSYEFFGCTGLETFIAPKMQCATNYCFYDCKSLKTFDFQKIKNIGRNAFENCTGISAVNAPVATVVQQSGLRNMSALTKADFGALTQIQASVFHGCTNFATLIIRTATLCSLANANAFTSTPFASGGTGGVLLIPSALVTAYTEATNWSVIYGYGTNRFLALEDYTVDGTVTGEIDWDKVNALFA